MIVQNLLYREQRPSSGLVPAILEDVPALFCMKHNRCGLAYDRAYTVYRKKCEICTFECENDLQSASNTHARPGFFQPFDAKNDFYAKKVSPVVHSSSPVQ